VPTLLNDVAQRALFIVLIFIYSFGYISLDVFIACFVAIHFLLLIALSIYILKEDKPSLKIDAAYFKKSMLFGMLGFGAVFLFATTASMGIKLLDSVVLGQFITLDLVGVYAIAAFIPTFIEAPANALEKIALPKIADSMVKNDYVEIKKIYALSSRFLFALGALLFLLVNANIKDLLSFLPEIYQQGADVVIILSLSALFNLVTGSNNALVFNSDRFYVGVVFLIIIALCTLVMLYLFIPEAGLIGAAWAICISSILYNLFKYLFILIKYKIQPFGIYTLITLILLLALYFAEKMISLNFHPLLNIVLKSSLISGLFLLITFYFGVIDKKLFKLFKK
jgi:O-antigen/teichoic acid export membrane protein